MIIRVIPKSVILTCSFHLILKGGILMSRLGYEKRVVRQDLHNAHALGGTIAEATEALERARTLGFTEDQIEAIIAGGKREAKNIGLKPTTPVTPAFGLFAIDDRHLNPC